jgi:hypothetical protein
MKLLSSTSGDRRVALKHNRFNHNWWLISAFLLTSYVHIAHIPFEAAQAEELKIANVEHDIDDIINTPQRKYRPSNYQRNGQIEADLPTDNSRRRQTEQRNGNSGQNRKPTPKRK